MRLIPFFVLFLIALATAPATPALADFAAGKAAYDKKDWAKAILELRPAAESGDASAMFLLGNMYMQGYGVGKNPKEAFGLYRRSAIAGNAEAMAVTGALLQQGVGTTANISEAFEWYGRSAKAGNPAGAFFYGLYLFRGNKSPDGKNILPDHPQSYKWMKVAAQQTKDPKIRDASTKIAEVIAKTLKPEDVKKMNDEFSAWKPLPVAELGPIPGVAADTP